MPVEPIKLIKLKSEEREGLRTIVEETLTSGECVSLLLISILYI